MIAEWDKSILDIRRGPFVVGAGWKNALKCFLPLPVKSCTRETALLCEETLVWPRVSGSAQVSGDPFELVHPKRHFNSQNNLLQRECQRLQHFHSTKHFAFPVKMPHALDVVESCRVVVVVVVWRSRGSQEHIKFPNWGKTPSLHHLHPLLSNSHIHIHIHS